MKHVLIVDDASIYHELIRHALEGSSTKLFTAQDGSEALALLNQETIDVLVTDLHMGAYSGYYLLDHLPDPRPEKIIVLTNDMQMSIEPKVKSYSFAITVLRKPVTAASIRAAILGKSA